MSRPLRHWTSTRVIFVFMEVCNIAIILFLFNTVNAVLLSSINNNAKSQESAVSLALLLLFISCAEKAKALL